ncbi:uncharacterized protein LOC108341488 [Vigna angularis]|uniref:uncharacterized protein LOC108341488 n=1 Tax=Phaseolus angularis TaxID=3914 RepID=UPI000809AC06|nr:uncharacterized protein LOC108341488 [Vigna angularis]
MDRYQKTVRRVKGLSPKLALQYVMPALKPGPFKDSVCRRAPKTMKELRERATDEIRVEEMKQSYKKEGQEVKGEKTDGRRLNGRTGKPGEFKQREPRGPQFQQYTPLNAPREKIFQEALSAELIMPPKKRPTLPGADDNKHCLYHKNMGHTTEECVTLKDKIEEPLRAGRLKKYVKADRPEPPQQQPRSPRRTTPWRLERREGSRHDRADHSRAKRRRSRSRSRTQDRPLRGHINMISGGFAGGGSTSSARKRHIQAL